MAKRNYSHKSYKKKNTTISIYKRETPEVSNPAKPSMTARSQMLAVSSFRGLRDRGLIEIKADPYSSPMRAGYPIPAVAQSCPVIDVNYSGQGNIAGNTLVEMMDSDRSKLLNVIDAATLTLRLRYLYLCYDRIDNSGDNKYNIGLNNQMLNSFFDAISTLEATQTTDLALFTSEFETDMPFKSASSDELSQAKGIMAALIHYQTVLQNATHPISKYCQTMSMYKYAMDMGYNREGALINSIYSLLQKKAFQSTVNSLGDGLSSEYLDKDWKKQMNVLSSFCSRKSNSLDSSLKTMVVTTRIPMLRRIQYTGSTPTILYDSDGLKISNKTLYDPYLQKNVTKDWSFEQLVLNFCKLIDVNSIIEFARRKLNGTLPSALETVNASGYYEILIKYLNYITDLFTWFKTKMTFIRSALKKLSFSNMVYWDNNNFVRAENIGDASITYHSLLEDIFSATLGGCASMEYDNKTKRWRSYTLWDKFTGVPSYDDKSGGSFLTFSMRSLPASLNGDTTSFSKIPLLFDNTLVDQETSFICHAINRFGKRYDVAYTLEADLGTDPILARLDVLDVNLSAKVPVISIASEALGHFSEISACAKFIQDCCGYGRVLTNDATHNYYSVCRDSLVTYVDFEIDDIQNDMITFCRNYSPFRISTPDKGRTMGFSSITTDK